MIFALDENSAKISNDSIVILGICRNVGKDLSADIAKLSLAFSDFSQVHFRIVESDSIDNTIEVLHSLQQIYQNFKFKTFGNLESFISNRWERIAYCRNACLSYMAEDPELNSVSYFAVADLDGVNSKIDRDAVLSCWVIDDWDVCTANQKGPYYDVFALRHQDWSPNDCWKFEAALKDQGIHPVLAREQAIYKRQRVISPNSEWIEVDSAFGGLAIYKRSILGEARYEGKLLDGSIVCEHVPFHQSLKSQGARIFINPSLINGGWNGHSQPHSLGNRVKRLIKVVLVHLGLGFLLV